jgi:hypothetical protein
LGRRPDEVRHSEERSDKILMPWMEEDMTS